MSPRKTVQRPVRFRLRGEEQSSFLSSQRCCSRSSLGRLLSSIASSPSFYREQSFLALFTEGRPFATQVGVGLLLGVVVAGLIAAVLLRSRPTAPLRDFFREIFANLRPTKLDIVVFSLVSGFSEELFFRGTLQPMWGLWVASLVFALAHVGGNVFTWVKAAFAAYVFTLGLLLGLLCEHAGLVAAIAAHASCNLVFGFALKRYLPAPPNKPLQLTGPALRPSEVCSPASRPGNRTLALGRPQENHSAGVKGGSHGN